MAMNRRTARILGAAAAGTAALVTLRELKKVRHRKEEEQLMPHWCETATTAAAGRT